LSSLRLHKKITTTSVTGLPAIADEVLSLLKGRTLLLLEGPVGAGKTELVKTLSQKLGLADAASPSYAIHHRYEDSSTGQSMDHVDLYRLDSEDDLESTGFWDLFQEPQGLIVIEWPERLNAEYLPLNWPQIKVTITKGAGPSDRVFEIVVS